MRELDVPDLERVSDVSDMASKVEESNNALALDRILSKIEKAPDDFDGIHCIDCGQEIIQARLNTGAFRDIHCQEVHERKISLYRRG
jgi:RNA polymerase-binding transcription factor DksA